jgi:hypothetical protein
MFFIPFYEIEQYLRLINNGHLTHIIVLLSIRHIENLFT